MVCALEGVKVIDLLSVAMVSVIIVKRKPLTNMKSEPENSTTMESTIIIFQKF